MPCVPWQPFSPRFPASPFLFCLCGCLCPRFFLGDHFRLPFCVGVCTGRRLVMRNSVCAVDRRSRFFTQNENSGGTLLTWSFRDHAYSFFPARPSLLFPLRSQSFSPLPEFLPNFSLRLFLDEFSNAFKISSPDAWNFVPGSSQQEMAFCPLTWFRYRQIPRLTFANVLLSRAIFGF